MLDRDSLSRLEGLKARMDAEKVRAEAVVKATESGYGFAILDDGRKVFLPPGEMLKAFQNDRVSVCIRPGKGRRRVAEIERLVHCPLGEFFGRCVRKGKALFVAPDLQHTQRWFFIPPHARQGVQDGDYVRGALLRHPIADGRPQAKVLEVLGNDNTLGIANRYAMAKYQLPRQWSEAAEAQIEAIDPQQETCRRDLTSLEFISIDAARTQDIDDALYADISSAGWYLYVAIADPTSFIEPESALEREIAERGCSVYFHGDAVPMMPERLSHDTCALVQGEIRPALVCKIEVADNGMVGDFEFIEALVRSRAKLSYSAVDRYLAGDYDELMSHATPLEALYQVYQALRTHRETHELVMEEHTDYRWFMNAQKKIDHIQAYRKLLSHKLVEECMIAANRCCAQFLSARQCSGPFIGHRGFNSGRSEEIKKFLAHFVPEFSTGSFNDLENYRSIMNSLMKNLGELPVRYMVNRLLTRAEIITRPKPHLGMGLPCYSQCTSPLRKFTDYLSHQQIKRALHAEPVDQISNEQLQELSARLKRARDATEEARQWLKCEYLLEQPETEYDVQITHLHSGGFTARIVDYGIDGLVDLRNDPEKFSYDRWAATLVSTTHSFRLGSTIRVKLAKAELHNREISFTPMFVPAAEETQEASAARTG